MIHFTQVLTLHEKYEIRPGPALEPVGLVCRPKRLEMKLSMS